jgi:hypothetical protein
MTHPDKPAMDMTDAEFNAALKAGAWRNPPAPVCTPNAANTGMENAKKAVREMTDSEFDAALKSGAWR